MIKDKMFWVCVFLCLLLAGLLLSGYYYAIINASTHIETFKYCNGTGNDIEILEDEKVVYDSEFMQHLSSPVIGVLGLIALIFAIYGIIGGLKND